MIKPHVLPMLRRALMAAAVLWALPVASAEPPFNPPVLALDSAPSLQQTLAALPDDATVLVGETHTRYDHHLVQLETLKFLHARTPDLAIGVEWFQTPYQQPLDDYLAGRIDETEMLERTGYFDRWRFDYRLYRPVIEYARANRIPIVALNAPAELTRKIGQKGLAALSPDERATLPADYVRGNAAYEARVRTAFNMHPMEGANFAHFLDVMLTWDETMADSAARYMAAHPGRRMLIFAGSGHIAFRDGIPARLERRIGRPVRTVLVAGEHTAEPGIADFFVLSAPRELPPAGLLGAFLENTPEGVRVGALTEESALGMAGIAKDDILLAIDGAPTAGFAAVKMALLDKKPGDKVMVRYRHRNWFGSASESTVMVMLDGESPPRRPQ
ncbi:ChaN family lipoprotein [Denitromonas iodatirespirans]|uniref:ChaN family lipoprotein n=1 Tax=Denitromonas iodatirespirans TaxID=2795389 RepID=A0A944HE31_DENI1|nr:ChaN family lipoprotein [Denitromonas iodatirespirans]MBT0962546.1 ChaN family lipoprotein [Denitromonas iodatirespirans]